MIRCVVTGMAMASIWAYGANAAETPNKSVPAPPNTFQMPDYSVIQQRLTLPVLALFRDRRYEEAEEMLRGLVEKFPAWPIHHYNLAAALARQNKVDEAFEHLDEAVRVGFVNRTAMDRDPDLAALRDLPQFADILAKIDAQLTAKRARMQARLKPKVLAPKLLKPNHLTKGSAIVDETNTVWEPRSNTLVVALPLHKARKYHRVYKGGRKVLNLLTTWYLRGQAAGNSGDLYDNRDDSHSRLSKDQFPQVTHVKYGDKARAAGMHYGVNTKLLFRAITFGNSSTAITKGPAWRSQARLVLTTPTLPARAFQQYANDHLYVYPENKDHDPDRGDLFPANTPYMIVSQGSSGSDRPFLVAISAILAAFDPDVKAFLRERHLVMPTLQMIFRSGMKTVQTPEDYLSAKAHPSVFEGMEIDLEKMIHQARDLRREVIPPRVDLRVIEESQPQLGVDYFGPSIADEVLFDTPSAIARIVRTTARSRHMVISADRTTDPNGRPLKFIWKVLRGDGEKITLTPRTENASEVEIEIAWHERRPVPFQEALTTDRVDIGVFADNGETLSAPSFVSFSFPPNQQRIYDKAGRISEISYDPADLAKRYLDPVLYAERKWQDSYKYTEDGHLLGWERITKKSTRQFTRHGAVVVDVDAEGRPDRAEQIRYEISNFTGNRRQITEIPTGIFVCYRYEGPSDALGEQSPCH